MSAYGFRPVERADLSMIGRWLASPAVRRWWGDPREQARLVADDLRDARMAMWIVSHDRRPFAFVQDYDPRAWGLAPLPGVPAGARGLDPFIGEPDMLGRGHGSAFLRQRVDALFTEGVPAGFIDPDPANSVAIRAYARAGFSALGEAPDWEGATVLVMLRTPSRNPRQGTR